MDTAESESCCSTGTDQALSSNQPKHRRLKLEIYNKVLERVKDSDLARHSGFEDELWTHFNRLPARYSIDFNLERSDDVFTHMNLLKLAADPDKRPGLNVRVVRVRRSNSISEVFVEVNPSRWNCYVPRFLDIVLKNNARSYFRNSMIIIFGFAPSFSGFVSFNDAFADVPLLCLLLSYAKATVVGSGSSGDMAGNLGNMRLHPPPMFGSTANLEALGSEFSDSQYQDGDSISNGNLWAPRPMHEITFSSDDKPKLLSQLTSLLGELNLNILEAHAFSTNDGFSLDVFVVQGWHYEETEGLEKELHKQIQKIKAQLSATSHPLPFPLDPVENVDTSQRDHVPIPTDCSDVWEIDFKLLKGENKVASGTYGDLYKGTYCSQDVAIKVLKPDHVTADMQKEFCQEVFIMRKVRHKNVVQFIGACTKPPFFCIITEFMSGGSLYDILHKKRQTFKLSSLLKIAIDISKGMSYLHQNSIIHRDLKTANLLMDENQIVKVADFGVARVKIPSGIMTAETGTYRWMAPEVIEHKPYDHKADVFSFGIVLWELLTRQIPYDKYTPLQAAVGVVQKNLRPTIPKDTHPKLTELLDKCWEHDPSHRPDFTEIIQKLKDIAKEVKDVPEKEKGHGKFLSALGLK